MTDIMTTSEVAKLLDCHPSTVGKHCKAGTIKGKKLNGIWLIDRASARAFAKTYTPEDAKKAGVAKRAATLTKNRLTNRKLVVNTSKKTGSATSRAVDKYSEAQGKKLAWIRDPNRNFPPPWETHTQ